MTDIVIFTGTTEYEMVVPTLEQIEQDRLKEFE